MNKKTKDIIFTSVVTAVVLLVIIGSISGFIMMLIEFDESEYDNFCQERGFKQATDTDVDWFDNNPLSEKTHIECDKEHQFLSVNCIDAYDCSGNKTNKWGDCYKRNIKKCSENTGDDLNENT